jgi:hypothetical protein
MVTEKLGGDAQVNTATTIMSIVLPIVSASPYRLGHMSVTHTNDKEAVLERKI